MKHLFRPAMLVMAGILAAGGATAVFANSGADEPVPAIELSAADDVAREEDAPGALIQVPADADDDDDDRDDRVDTQDSTIDTNPEIDSVDSWDRGTSAVQQDDDSIDTQDDSVDAAPAQQPAPEPDSVDSVDSDDVAPAQEPAPQPEPDSVDDDSVDVESADDSVDSDD